MKRWKEEKMGSRTEGLLRIEYPEVNKAKTLLITKAHEPKSA